MLNGSAVYTIGSYGCCERIRAFCLILHCMRYTGSRFYIMQAKMRGEDEITEREDRGNESTLL
jgi:hypothetical protein